MSERGPHGAVPGSPELDALARALATMLSVPTVLISVLGERVQEFVGAYGLPFELQRTRSTHDISPLCRHVAETARPVIVHDARRRHSNGGAALVALGVSGYAGVPMLVGETAIGVVAAIDGTARAWTEREVHVLRTFAQVAAAVQTRHDPRQHSRELELSLVRERALTGVLLRAAIADTATEALENVATHVGWPYAELITIENGQLRVLASHARDRSYLAFFRDGTWPAEDDALVRGALVNGHATWLADLAHQRGYARAGRAGDAGLATGFAIAVPGHSTVLALYTAEAEPDRTDLARIARAASVLMGPTLVRMAPSAPPDRRTGELEILALHDELTGLLNRRGFYAVAGGQLALARRRQLGGMVLFVDVDGLKERNDRDGHAAGDELLRMAAGVLRATFRDADTVGRVGGDEFVVFSIDATVQDLPGLVARLDDELRIANDGRHAASALRWSVGAVAFDGADGQTLDALIVEADRRMYVVKRHAHPLPGSVG